MTYSIALAIALAMWFLLEARVVVTCLSAPLAGGENRLSKLGSRFLGTEAWVLVAMGVAHAAYPEAFKALLHVAAPSAFLYIGGWMLRDLFLWTGPRLESARLSRSLISIGAFAQGASAVDVVVAVIREPGLVGALSSVATDTLLGRFLLPALLIGAVAQFALFKLPPSEYHSWGSRNDSGPV